MNNAAASGPRYDVALSFAGEDRKPAKALAALLEQDGLRVFYDEYERAALWGKDLHEHLADVYTNQARYCVMFISKYYLQKPWPIHERRSALARAFRERHEYILPVRLDETMIPGIPDTVAYVDLRNTSIQDLATLLANKLGYVRSDAAPARPSTRPSTIPMPRRNTVYSDRDRDAFLRDAYVRVSSYFQDGIRQLSRETQNTEGHFEEVHHRKFLCKAYVGGKAKARAKVWLGGLTGGSSICYYDGTLDFGDDNAMNDSLSVHVGPDGLCLRAMGGHLTVTPREECMTMEVAAEYLWRRFISQLER